MSRRFAIIKPEDLWTGPRTRELRKHPADVRELLAYLLSGPTSDRWGIWNLELDMIVLQSGRKDATILKAFSALSGLDLAHYDPTSQFVYVPDMPESQFSRWPLLPNDGNVRHAKRWYTSLPKNPFLGFWFDRHLDDLFLTRDPDACTRRDGSAIVAPPAAEPTVEPTVDLLGERPLPVKVSRNGHMTPAEIDHAFDKIVLTYPKRDALDRSRKTFHKLKPTPELVQTIYTALAWQTKQRDWLKEGGAFAPRLDRYFTDKRWMDRPRRVPHANSTTVQTMAAMADFIEGDGEECRTHEPNENDLPRRSGK